jgi:hypothetical protein
MEAESCTWLSSSDRLELAGWVVGRNTPQNLVWRARIVLMWGDAAGLATLVGGQAPMAAE